MNTKKSAEMVVQKKKKKEEYRDKLQKSRE
jgi:hypothetical protein